MIDVWNIYTKSLLYVLTILMCIRRFIVLTVRIIVRISIIFLSSESVTVGESKKAKCCLGINPFLHSMSRSSFCANMIPLWDLYICPFAVLFCSWLVLVVLNLHFSRHCHNYVTKLPFLLCFLTLPKLQENTYLQVL